MLMKRVNKSKVQETFINYLVQEGHVELALPNDMVLEVGITQENKNGDLEKTPDYCWVIVSQKGRSVSIDEYNLGLRYQNEKDRIICEHELVSNEGDNIKVLDVI
jgi:hypothetical protein